MRSLLPLLSILPAVLLPAAPAQDPPRIVSSIPSPGAKDVPPGLGRIVVIFDRDMDTRSFSLVPLQGRAIPPLAGAPRFLDARTLSVSLKELKPGVTYGLGFNSPTRKGFRSKEGVPLAPWALEFTTAGPKAPPSPEPAGAAGGGPPRVLRTSPPAGATGVDPSLEKVEIWFSREMDPRSMSLLRLPGKARLGYVPGKPPFFDGPRHLVIPVRLEPGMEYGVGINSGTKRGFVSKEGVPAAPFRLVFRTAPAEKGPPPLEPPAGRWGRKSPDGRVEHWFFPGGAWSLLRVSGDRRTFVHGSWTPQGKEIRLRTAAGRALPPLLWSLDGETLVLKRSSADPHPKRLTLLPFYDARDLAGRWRTTWGPGNSRTWDFRKDGTFTCLTVTGGDRIERKGRWRTRGLELQVRDEEAAEPEVYGWTVEEGGKLALTSREKGLTQIYGRLPSPRPAPSPAEAAPLPPKSPAPPAPPAPKADPLLGRWVAVGDGGKVEILLTADHRFTTRISSPDGEETSRGTWKKEGSCLVVREEPDGEITRVAFRFLGPDQVEFTIEGEKIRFTRAGKGGPSSTPVPPQARGGTRPAELVGAWAARDATGAMTLDLRRDGSFRFLLRRGMVENVLTGTWTVSGGKIRLNIQKPNPGTYEMPFDGPTAGSLTITLDDMKVVLVKQ